MNVDRVCQRVARYINNSNKTQRVLRFVNDNTSISSTFLSFAISTTIRPVATIAITPNKNDGKYSASSSIASAFVEIAAGMLMLKPGRSIIAKSSKELFDKTGTVYFHNKNMLRTYQNLNDRFLKFVTLPIISATRFALVYSIGQMLNKIGITKGSKK